MSGAAPTPPPLPPAYPIEPADEDFPEGDIPRVMTRTYRFPPAHSFPPVADCDRDVLLAIAARGASGSVHELVVATPHLVAVCALLAYQVEPARQRAELELAAMRSDAATAKLRISMLEEAVTRERRTTLQELTRVVAELEYSEELRKTLATRDTENDALRRENLELRRLVLMYGPERVAARPDGVMPTSDIDFGPDPDTAADC